MYIGTHAAVSPPIPLAETAGIAYTDLVAILGRSGGELDSTGRVEVSVACRGSKVASLKTLDQLYLPITTWQWLPN